MNIVKYLSVLTACLGATRLEAATALLTISGVTEQASALSPYPVGTPFVVEATWALPTAENLPRNLGGPAFAEMIATGTNVLGASSFLSKSLAVNTWNDPDNPGARPIYFAFFSLVDRLPGEIDSGFTVDLHFTSTSSFFNEGTLLPGNLNDWNLLAADFEFTLGNNSYKGDNTSWFVRSTHYTSLTLTTIPEPSSYLLGLATAGGFGWRRRRPARLA
jgi:hypothetical protein